MTIKEPMLAAPLLDPTDVHDDYNIFMAMKELRYPVLATLKKDGIRALKTMDLVSRRFKMIPNVSVRTRAMKIPAGFDMELWNPDLQYDQIQSIVMSREHKESDLIQFHVLDNWNIEGGYAERMFKLHHNYPATETWNDIDCQLPVICKSAEELFEFEKKCIEEEGEGICFRTPMSPYKQGRSTLGEQYLVKLSRFVRTECTIIDFEEQFLNVNKAKTNAVGKSERSSQLHGLRGKNTLGAFIVQDDNGMKFRVGTGVGLTDKLRKEIWDSRDEWLLQRIVVKHKPHGQKVKPRSPIYVGRREKGF